MTADRVESWGGGLTPSGGALSRPTVVRRLGGHRVIRVVGRRLLMAVPLLFIVSALSFVLVSVTPGDAARQILGAEGSPEEYTRLRRALGLDLPLYKQY